MIVKKAALPPEAVAMLLAVAQATMASRAPNFVVGHADDPYLHRWRFLPRGDNANCYVHLFHRDDDRALHDHPYDNLSVPLLNPYVEVTDYAGDFKDLDERAVVLADKSKVGHVRKPGDLIYRRAEEPHRVVVHSAKPVSLFFCGPRVRDWGFWCGDRWVQWQVFHGQNDPANPQHSGGPQKGRGCG